MMIKEKILTRTAVVEKVATLHKRGAKVVFTNGCFDILHSGHIQYLEKAKSFGDVLVVGLNSDSSVRKIKGPKKPVVRHRDRALIVAALEMVDFVVVFNEETPLNLITVLKPDILVKGADWKNKDIVGSDVVTSYGGKVKRVIFKKGYSTSGLIFSILSRFK